jgi:hypothetical protein
MKQIAQQEFRKHRIDRDLSYAVLEQVRSEDRRQSGRSASQAFSFPVVDARQIIDGAGAAELTLNTHEASARLAAIDETIRLSDFTDCSLETVTLNGSVLGHIGIRLLPYLAYGVLNGGSATSYVDEKKNASFYPPLYELISQDFSKLAELSENRPKGLSPAYINPDGTPGCSYMELKMRALLLLELRYTRETGKSCRIPMFQMTSEATDGPLREAYDAYRDSPFLTDLIEKTGHDITRVISRKQPLIAAMTPASDGFPRDLFTRAYGKRGRLLPLPGGHGQNFLVLKDVYRQLYAEAKRFAYLVNVDNIGNTPSPVSIAVTALTGCDGSFEFSYKSPVDIKGGVLLRGDEDGELTCRDIGVAISSEEVQRAESRGKPILFNCATGLFSLEYLDRKLDDIIKDLPLRVSEQHKDAGIYSQAEQVTWEIIDLMEYPAVIAVNKHQRFLAAKLLSESIMSTRASRYAEELLERNSDYRDFCEVSLKLEQGFYSMMEEVFALKLTERRWR